MFPPHSNEKKIKICHIISGDLWAGAEVMAYQLLTNLARNKDLEILVIILNPGILADNLLEKKVKIRIINEAELSFLKIFQTTRTILRNFVPDIIHSHRYKENLLSYLVSKSLQNVSLITTLHGLPEFIGHKNSFKHRLVNKLDAWLMFKAFNKLVVVSEDMRKKIIGYSPEIENRVNVIHNGIPLPEKNIWRNGKKTFVIGSAGRFFPVKDYSLMVEIAREVLAEKPQMYFNLAGEGPEKPIIEKKISEYHIQKNFKLSGFYKDISLFYKQLSVFLNTSVHEGIPMSVLEAMSYGIPVVAPNVGGLPEIIQSGVDGFLLENRDPHKFAQVCVQFYNTPKLMQRISMNAIQKIKDKFSIQKMAREYREIYKDLALV